MYYDSNAFQETDYIVRIEMFFYNNLSQLFLRHKNVQKGLYSRIYENADFKRNIFKFNQTFARLLRY